MAEVARNVAGSLSLVADQLYALSDALGQASFTADGDDAAHVESVQLGADNPPDEIEAASRECSAPGCIDRIEPQREDAP